MQWHEQLDAFRADVVARRWDRVELFLRKTLDGISHETIDSMEYESVRSMLLMINVLAQTKLGKVSSKGGYLFARLVRKAWLAVDNEARWQLLCNTISFYDLTFDKPYIPDACLEYFYVLSDAVGIAREEVVRIILFKTGQYCR